MFRSGWGRKKASSLPNLVIVFWRIPISKWIGPGFGNHKSPSKVIFFIWLARKERIQTVDAIVRRGIVLDALCPLCSLASESVDCLLSHCPFTSYIWHHFLVLFQVCLVFPRSVPEFLSSWRVGAFSAKGKIIWKCLPFAL
uniref:Reverse transcriptase zinc-binding domain-containing protein n=1 Tax=Nelumbo nucifera TaxID=4432 RepID=A0A822ZSC8_NELNU|nr:TPA_asm: hypothetical protein HUJ06_004479 [Nelumbo nucifera]